MSSDILGWPEARGFPFPALPPKSTSPLEHKPDEGPQHQDREQEHRVRKQDGGDKCVVAIASLLRGRTVEQEADHRKCCDTERNRQARSAAELSPMRATARVIRNIRTNNAALSMRSSPERITTILLVQSGGNRSINAVPAREQGHRRSC